MATTKPDARALSDALARVFVSPNECDSNWEAANVVDGLFAIARSIHRLADAVEKASGNFQENQE